MANEFYDHTTYPSNGAAGSSSAMRSELNSIEAGFDKLPTMAGNGGEIIAVNSGATALEAITTTGTGSGVRATSPTFVTPLLGTPTSGVLTNCTGVASGLTAGTVTVADAAADTTTWILLGTSQTGNLTPATDAGLTYNASTNVMTVGEVSTNGTAGGLEIFNVNNTDAYQATISGSMTLNNASLNGLLINPTITGGAATTSARGINISATFTPTANSDIQNIANTPTLNSGISPSSFYGQINTITLGASALGGTITTAYGQQVGFSPHASATTNITTFYAFRAGNIADGTAQAVSTAVGFSSAMNTAAGTRWGFLHSGTANNAFNANTRFGGVTAPTVSVDVTGAVLATTFIRSSGATSGIGYTTGAGSTVTQGVSKSTGVTLNFVTGKITMHNAALAADAIVSFTLTNSAIEAEDILHIVHHATGTFGSYVINSRCASGSAVIDVANRSAGSLSEAIVLKYVLIKAVAA